MNVPYSGEKFTPPIPVLPVRFRLIDRASETPVLKAIVDTGADLTIAPLELLEDLGALAVLETELVSQWGDRHPVWMYQVDVVVGERLLPNLDVAGDEQAEEVILGRNVLNKLAVFLDGPQEQTEILEEPFVQRLRSRREGPPA